jgi:hypothetical protein
MLKITTNIRLGVFLSVKRHRNDNGFKPSEGAE